MRGVMCAFVCAAVRQLARQVGIRISVRGSGCHCHSSHRQVGQSHTCSKHGVVHSKCVGMLSVPEVPAAARMAMSDWGPRFRRQAAAATGRQVACGSIRVGTDCSGLEAPVLSLRALGLTHEHLFSSEIKEKARKFIAMNFMPSSHASTRGGTSFISDDMLARVSSTLPYVELYIVGFPCKPFSHLRCGKSGGFKEKAAKPFIKLLNVLKEMMPALAILENVEGIKRYMPKVWKALNKLKLYEILTVHVDPFCMGEPVHRPRIYFVLIRADVAVRDLDTKAALLVDAVGSHDRRATVAERIFAAHDARTMAAATRAARSTSTKAKPKKRPAAAGAAFASSQGRGLKWKQLHVQHDAAPSQLPGATERQRSLHGILRQGADRKPKAVDLAKHVVDLSQSLGRTRMYINELPVIAPSSKIWLAEQGRWLTGMEKILVHMVPIHTLKWPAELHDGDLADLGGNTMHVMAVRLLSFGTRCGSEW